MHLLPPLSACIQTFIALCLQERLRGSEWAAVAVAAAGVMVLGASAQVRLQLQCCAQGMQQRCWCQHVQIIVQGGR